MEAKAPAPIQTQTQSQQPPGQAVVFKATQTAGKGMSFSPHAAKTVLASLVMLFLVGGVGVGVYLVSQQQQIKSRASNEIPENLSAVVPKNAVNPASPSAQTSPQSSTTSSDLNSIVIPELEESETTASEAATFVESYDFSDDGIVNSVDLSVMYSGWGTPKNEIQHQADLNGDGIINGIDYSLFLPHFSQTSGN